MDANGPATFTDAPSEMADAASTPHPPPKIRLRRFFASLLPALLLGALFCPSMRSEEATNAYLIGWGMQLLLAFVLAFYGWRTGIRRHVTQAFSCYGCPPSPP